MNPFKAVKSSLKTQALKITTSGLNPRYLWRASVEKSRYWMLNSIYPKNVKGQNLHLAIKEALENDKFILHIGCGTNAQALRDLKALGAKNLIGLDFQIEGKLPADIVCVSLDLRAGLPVEDNSFRGVVFGSYLFSQLEPEELLKLLEDIDRITGEGSKGFLGPFYPRKLFKSPFSEKYKDFKNPLFGFVRSRSTNKNKWRLYRSRTASLSTVLSSSRNNRISKFTIPFITFSDLGLKAMSAKLAGNAQIKKDYKPVLPNEYYITFEK